ncbi:hypothetical protein V499_01331 [Pseudogymnoascus sp. VKM F-103]|nr:hypothetical protein V499_01331 [Pseudogymnoascus sp. VKM F-103]
MAESEAPTPSPRMILEEVRIIFESRPGGDIVYPLTSPEEIEKAKSPYILKEGCHYKISVTFRVQHEIISGLRSQTSTFRKGLRVAKDQQTLGSFGPQSKPHEVTFPRHGWEEAPSGMLSRGSYTSRHKFADDDSVVHAEWEMAFDIKSEW